MQPRAITFIDRCLGRLVDRAKNTTCHKFSEAKNHSGWLERALHPQGCRKMEVRSDVIRDADYAEQVGTCPSVTSVQIFFTGPPFLSRRSRPFSPACSLSPGVRSQCRSWSQTERCPAGCVGLLYAPCLFHTPRPQRRPLARSRLRKKDADGFLRAMCAVNGQEHGVQQKVNMLPWLVVAW